MGGAIKVQRTSRFQPPTSWSCTRRSLAFSCAVTCSF